VNRDWANARIAEEVNEAREAGATDGEIERELRWFAAQSEDDPFAVFVVLGRLRHLSRQRPPALAREADVPPWMGTVRASQDHERSV
jgi:hypothetical protein